MKNKILLFSIIGLLSSCETEDKVYNPQYGEGYYILTPKVISRESMVLKYMGYVLNMSLCIQYLLQDSDQWKSL